MNVIIIATRTCHHRHILERQLQTLGVPYQVRLVDEHPYLVAEYGLRSSPNLLVDDELVFRAMHTRLPSEAQLRACLQL
ncbi:MAG: glutaredoxin family protein [Anaerolineae bacterium]